MMRLGIGVGIGRQRVSGGFDADYQAVLNAMQSAGYTLPSSAQQVKQNTLMVAWKAAGFFQACKGLAVMMTDGESRCALFDWKRLVAMTPQSSPIFTTNQGYAGDGVAARIDTGLLASALSSNNASIGVYVQNDGGNGGYVIGNVGVVGLRLRNSNSNNNQLQTTGTTSVSVDLSGTGFKAVNKLTSGNLSLYNQTTRTTATATDVSTTNEIQLLRWGTTFSNSRIGMWFASDNIDGAIYTAMRSAFLNYVASL